MEDFLRKRSRASESTLEMAGQAVIAHSVDAIISIDEQGRILLWNPAAEKLLGYTAQEVMGREAGKIIVSPGQQAHYYARLKQFTGTKSGANPRRTFETQLQAKGGYSFPVELSLFESQVKEERQFTVIIGDSRPRLRHAAGERQQAEDLVQQNARLIRLLQESGKRTALTREIIGFIKDEADIGMILQHTVAKVGKLIAADGCEIWEYNREAGVFYPLLYRYHTQENGPGSEISPDALTSNSLVILDDVFQDVAKPSGPKKSGTAPQIRSLLQVPILYQDKLLGILRLYTLAKTRHWEDGDVAFVSHVAAQLAISLYQAAITSDLLKALEDVDEAGKKKGQFITMITHELKTPLNAIIGYSDMLEHGYAGELTEKQLRYVHNLAVSGHHLLDVVNDVLDISRIQAGKVRLSPEFIAIRPFMAEIESLIREFADNREIQVTFEIQTGLAGLVADPKRLRQIFFNLLSNAIKFNHAGGKVHVRLFKTGDRQWLLCQIQDTGVGIPDEKLPELFNPFHQIDNSLARKQEGTGLGLALTKHLVEMHGGSISVESKMGQGSTFTFRLPVHGR